MPGPKRDTTRALKLARDIRLTMPIDRLTPRLARMFDRLEKILEAMDARTGRRDPSTRAPRAR